jgi:hypothetical protein
VRVERSEVIAGDDLLVASDVPWDALLDLEKNESKLLGVDGTGLVGTVTVLSGADWRGMGAWMITS